MKKTLVSILTAGLAFAMINTSGTVYAEDFTESQEIPQSKNSEATVTFSAPTTKVAPYDPLNPDQELENHDGMTTGYSGPLSLDYVSNLRFNEKDKDGEVTGLDVTSKNMEYKTTSESPYIQVSDYTGTGNGWHVTAQASRFTSSEKNSLNGAIIALKNGDAVSTSEDVSNGPSIKKNIELLTGGDSELVVNALPTDTDGEFESAQGIGTWLMRWFDTGNETENEQPGEVVLKIPGGTASTGNHTSSINWTLSSGPVLESSNNNVQIATEK